MKNPVVRLPLYLPAQGASETEATLVEWYVEENDRFEKGQVLAQIDSAKSVFDFEAPCEGRVVRRFFATTAVVPLTEPICEIDTSDVEMRQWIPPVALGQWPAATAEPTKAASTPVARQTAVLLGLGSYLPQRVVDNAELLAHLPHISQEYVEQVTGIRQRHWAAGGEKPSDMAYAAAIRAIEASNIDARQIDAIILATTTPDAAMPSTACILQGRLGLTAIPAFDINAACCGWLYAVTVAQSMILSGMARNVLAVSVDMQSQLLDKNDESAYFLFGDGAGAGVVSSSAEGHRICHTALGADSGGLHMAGRATPGYLPPDDCRDVAPWIRLDGPALFRAATDYFTSLVRQSIAATGWAADEIRWIVPHQANGRILKAAAKRSGIPYERFFVNVGHVGNTSSASIPLALCELQDRLKPGDKLLLCSVGAGLTTAALALEW